MKKWFASACLIAALLLMLTGSKAPVFFEVVPGDRGVEGDAGVRGNRITSRSPQVLADRSTRSRDLLLAVTSREPVKGQAAYWNEEAFQQYLANLSEQDAKALLNELLGQKSQSTVISGNLIDAASSSPMVTVAVGRHVKMIVIDALIKKLAKGDFHATLALLETHPNLKKGTSFTRAAFEALLRGGAKQDPKKAWEVYLVNCPPSYG